ncbi:MAG: hypothetical protein M3144_00200 [Actinomycetota bacterium]|nr:hypothetical protein [Actinomycetota bacterium]
MFSSRAKAYVLGLCTGAVLVVNWRPLTKQAVKAGVTGMDSLKRAAVRGAENLSDVTHEALWEMSQNGSDVARDDTASHANGNHPPRRSGQETVTARNPA